MATAPEVTANDLLALPEGGPRYELLDGEVYQVNPPARRHQEIVGNVLYWLHMARNAGLGHPYVALTALVLPGGAMTLPDAMFIRAGREEVLADDAIRGVPDLIVEVLPPTTRDRDRKTKYRIYERNGVPHYWWIDPDEETASATRSARTDATRRWTCCAGATRSTRRSSRPSTPSRRSTCSRSPRPPADSRGGNAPR